MHDTISATVDRAIGIARFDTGELRRLLREPRGTAQAALVVIVVSIAVAIPSLRGGWLALALIAAIAVAVAQGHPSLATPGTAWRAMVQRVQRHVPVPAWLIALVAAGIALLVVPEILPVFIPVAAWLTFSVIVWFACNEVVGHPATRVGLGPIVRVVGFSFAPAVLFVLVNAPLIGAIAAITAVVWTVALLAFSIRQTTRLGTARSLLATTIASAGTLIAALPLIFISIL